MTLTSAQRIRQRIQDAPRLFDKTFVGDGTASTFLLNEQNLTTASAYIPIGGTAWSATGASFNASGSVSFSGVISANSAYRLTFVYSVFSDAVIDEYISAEGSLIGAALQCAYDLQFDSIKRARWYTPDGSQMDDTAGISAVNGIIAALQAEQKQESDSLGGFASWAETQAEY